MLSGMTAATFHAWQDYFLIEPFGEQRAELRHGQKMAMYANYHRDPDKKPEPFKAIDFMNYTEQPQEEPAPAEDPAVLSARIAAELFRM